jgi:hypothetical protein
MLSETWRLLQALERSDIKRVRKHKRVQTPGRTSPCLRVCLNKDGKIASIQDIVHEDWPSWTVMEGNQSSFPVVRVQEPLFNMERGHEGWAKLGFDEKGKRRRLPADQVRLIALEELLKDRSGKLSGRAKTLWQRLREQKAKELADCAKYDDLQIKTIQLFADRFKQAAKHPELLLTQVAERAVESLRQGRLTAIDAVEQLMVGKGPPDAQGKRPGITVQLAFDIEETGECGPHLYSQSVRDRLAEVLPQEPFWKRDLGGRDQPDRTGVDALTGESVTLEERTFPKVDLPVPSVVRRGKKIGRKRFPLVSMFSEARCNIRYGMADARVFPVAQTRAIQLKEALEEITADGRREKTWQHVASGRFDTRNGRKIEKPDLLIVYVEEKPQLDVKTAGYFGQGQAVTEAKFEVDAATVCEAFRGIIREKPHSRLNLFLIREVSKGQAQVVLAESPTVEDVLDAAERWQRAVQNMPVVTLYLQIGKTPDGQVVPEIRDARPLAPYPDQVVRLLSHQWVRDGSSPKGRGGKPQKTSQEIVGPGLAEVLALMMRMEGKWEQSATRMLNLFIGRVVPLLIGLFGAKHIYGPRQAQGKHEPFLDYPRRSRETALGAVAVLGILLDAFESRKENYMKEVPYQVGQALALADTLHKDYCIVVRKGQMPNSLIGTSLMRRALDNPAGALADLSERMMEYIRWAKVAQVSQDWPQDDQRRIAVNEARKKLRQYQPLAEGLGTSDLVTECNDVMKAQLLLGFLASSPVEKEIDEGKEETL